MINVEDVLERINTKDGLEHYGVKFDHKGFAQCPFHYEKTPSFYYYKKSDTYYCFSCGKGGNIVNFVADYFNYTLPRELPKVLEQIDKDFNLGLNKDLTPEEKKVYLEEKKLNKAVQKAESNWEDSLSMNYEKWAKVHSALYKQHVFSSKEDAELADLLEQLETALEDYSGNELRAWPLQTLSDQQRNLVEKTLEKGCKKNKRR